MLTRRTLLELPFFTLIPVSRAAAASTRRALVVGIDKYEVTHGGGAQPPPAGANAGADDAAKPKIQRAGWFNLDGAVNDAQLIYQLLIARFGFEARNMVFMTNGQATRERILAEFQRQLLDAAAPGDISLFYYAGHGSQVRNLASPEADQLDETLVPADAVLGSRDIRDKELARLCRAVAQKKVALTVILDSCHSGGMQRGAWNGIRKTRFLPPDPRPVSDPDTGPGGQKLPDPASLGVLFLAAAREDQPAGETTVVDRGSDGANRETAHGAFTAALARVLQSPVADQSVAQICARVQAMLASEGQTQVPICAGSGREGRGLLGQEAGLGAAIAIPVDGITNEGKVRLRGGSALGLSAGCTLARAGDAPVRLELTRVDLATSEARPLGGAGVKGVQPGDLFKLDSWVAPPDSAIKVYFPKDGPDAAAVISVGRAVAQLGASGVEVLEAPSKDKPPTHVLYWREGAYHLERNPAAGHAADLGPSPAAADLVRALDGAAGARLWPVLPPDRSLCSEIRLGQGSSNAAVQVVTRPADCVYFLAGRLNQEAVEYAWFYKDAAVVDPNEARLPLRTDWKTSAGELTNLALRLARVYAWLNLDGPGGGGDQAFPYRLVFETAGTHQPAGSGPFKFGGRYKFVFQADSEALKRADASGGVAKRYVYVFLIDSDGQAKCFFPDPANGNEGNRLPRGDPAPRIEATRSEYDVEIAAPAGTDNYFMVASREPLDPGVFEWSGVSTRPARRGSGNPLEFLFGSVGEGMRGGMAGRSVPVTWSIQSTPIRSVP